MRRALWLLGAVVSLAGCGSSGPVTAQCNPRTNRPAPPPVGVVLVGQRAERKVELAPAVFCQGGNPQPTGVVTEVLDSLNAPVAHEASAARVGGDLSYETTVSFTPARAGVHLLSARFEPALGLVQEDLQVAADATGRAPSLRFSPGLACDEAWQLGQVGLCRAGATLVGVRAGTEVLRVAVDRVVVAGGAAWWWTGAGEVTRAVDDGSALVTQTASGVPAPAQAWAVADARLLLVTGTVGTVVEAGGAGLSVATSGTVFAPEPRGAMAQAGETSAWLSPAAQPPQLCWGAGLAAARCVAVELEPTGAQGDVLWFRGPTTDAVARGRVFEGGATPSVTFLPAQSALLEHTRQALPAFTFASMLLAPEPDEFVLTAFRAPAPALRQGVTATHAWFQLFSGEVVLVAR